MAGGDQAGRLHGLHHGAQQTACGEVAAGGNRKPRGGGSRVIVFTDGCTRGSRLFLYLFIFFAAFYFRAVECLASYKAGSGKRRPRSVIGRNTRCTPFRGPHGARVASRGLSEGVDGIGGVVWTSTAPHGADCAIFSQFEPTNPPFPWVPRENKTSFKRISSSRSMNGGELCENCSFTKKTCLYRTID